MALHPDLEKLAGAPYRLKNGPDKLGMIDPSKDGVNCQFLAHLALRLTRGVSLSPLLLSREIFLDTLMFVDINPADAAVGDIFIFGKPNEPDYRCLHLTVCADKDKTGEPLLIHANGLDNSVSLWPLASFYNHRRYQKLFAIKRLRGEL